MRRVWIACLICLPATLACGSGAASSAGEIETSGDGDGDASGDGDADGDLPGDGDGDSGDGDGDNECPPLPPYEVAEDWAALTEGVSSIDFGGGAPSTLVVHGPGAFALIRDQDADVGAAAATLPGGGRVVVWSHANQLGGQLAVADGARLAHNAARWAGHAAQPVVGVPGDLPELAANLAGAGFEVVAASPAQLDGLDVYAMSAEGGYSEGELQAITAFVDAGGGLLVAGQAWWWASQNPGTPLSAYPGNAVLAAAGISITDDAWAFDGPTGNVSPSAPTQLSNPHHAIDALRMHLSGEQALQQAALDEALASSLSAVEGLEVAAYPDFFCRAKAYAALVDPAVPSVNAPFVPGANGLATLALSIDVRVGLGDLPELISEGHAAAAEFPGLPAAGEPTAFTVSIDGDHEGRDPRFGYAGAAAAAWRSTGIYAAPGALIEVEVPAPLVGQGLEVQIGSHSDTLWSLDEWHRVPALVRRDALVSETTRSASAFGGLVYIIVPTGAALGTHEVTISGGMLAPRYVHGLTSNAEWIDEQRERPGAWAEFESSTLVITVPSESVAGVDDPEALMELWDTVLDDQAMLAGISPERPRAERFVVDRQISAGWMHSGYPIMAHLESTQEFVDLAVIEQGVWGPLHELGHNHQWREFVLPGTTEANVNLWSVHSSEGVLGIDRGDAHPALAPEMRAARISSYVDGGADFWNEWNVWTALETYLQLQEAFGWAPFSALHTEYYYALPSEPALSDAAKIDAFAREFGAQVDRDLGPFFLAWGFPLSQQVIDELAARPAWAEDPMN